MAQATAIDKRTRAPHPVLLGLAIGLVAANLRPALASVGPVLTDLRTSLGLSGAEASALTAAPVLCLGAAAAAAPALARRWGMEPVIAAILAVIGAGLLLRVGGGTTVLFAGTVLASGAIAIANVLLPAIIKRDFTQGSGTMMGVYSMALTGSAAVAAGATVPIGDALRLGWQGALGAWALPAVVALLGWLPFTRSRHSPPASRTSEGSLLRDPLAWQVTVFFGLQSLSFYAVLAWLPSIYRDHGYSAAAAGLLLSTSVLVQIPISLVLPSLAARMPAQRALIAGATLVTIVGLAGVLLAPTAAPYLWVLLVGVGQGSAFPLGLTLFVLRTRTTADTARLSAMAQTCGYLIAASGPLLVGTVHDATRSWTPAIALLLLLAVPQLVTGVLAGRNRYVGPAQQPSPHRPGS
ncbi:MFS transporter [Planosporangium flavigriseum]|uniref:MFS transporter n=1 Tax=Planosporangium flavigriseum TaxID=373681 RepID=A0A8J3LEI2_9ACTN|nr:MFS transporter [Planosporangium flavigriseum]NJC65009.1 MFS transporter [Planosporangium flavigriseum]GIG71622.1 MFS transporter [Planosporangium flavigriseum]